MAGKLRVGIIGLNMGRYHLDGYLKCPDVQVAALCELNQNLLDEFLPRAPGARGYRDYGKMLAEKLDIVSVVTPNYLHAPMTIDALRSGAHVLVEKPMSTNVADGQKMVQAARKCRRKLMIHHNHRFHPMAWHLHRLIEEKALGEIYYIRARWHRRCGIPPLGWFTTKKLSGGGALFDIGVHCLDLAMWFMGFKRVQTVTGAQFGVFGPRIARRQKKTFDVDDLSVALLKLAGGASITLETSWAVNLPGEEFSLEVCGTEGGAVLKPWENLRLFTDDAADGKSDSVITRYTPGPASAVSHFVECVRENRQPLVAGERGVDVLRVLDAIRRSSASGREVRLNAQSYV